jgi:hypothetical protein
MKVIGMIINRLSTNSVSLLPFQTHSLNIEKCKMKSREIDNYQSTINSKGVSLGGHGPSGLLTMVCIIACRSGLTLSLWERDGVRVKITASV